MKGGSISVAVAHSYIAAGNSVYIAFHEIGAVHFKALGRRIRRTGADRGHLSRRP